MALQADENRQSMLEMASIPLRKRTAERNQHSSECSTSRTLNHDNASPGVAIDLLDHESTEDDGAPSSLSEIQL